MTHGAWSAWRFSPAPSYFPDMLSYAVGYLIFGSAPLRIWFVTAVQVVALAILADRLAVRIRPALTAFGRGLVLGAACLAVAVANHTTTMIGIFFNANNIQVPTLISSLLMLILTIDAVEGRRPKRASAAILMFGALAYASSAVFVLSFTLPCLFALLVTVVSGTAPGANRATLLRAACAVVASQVLGSLLARALTWNAPLEGRLSLDAERALLAWRHFEDATVNIVAPDNPWSVGLFVACTVAWLLACATALRTLVAASPSAVDVSERLIALFILCSSITSVGGAIASGGFSDLYGYRYFMTFAAVSLVWAATRIDRRIAAGPYRDRWTFIGALGVVALTTASIGQTLAASRRDVATIARHGAIARPEEDVARCLAGLIARGMPLDAGIADYWYARGVRYHLDRPLPIEPVAADLSPFFWISSLAPLEHPRTYGISRYNFAIVRRQLPDVMAGYDLARMRIELPVGYETHRCDAADVDVLVYRGDELDRKVRMRIDNFVFRERGRGRLTYVGAELPSQVGTIDGDAMRADGGSPGYLVFGPYIHLDAGRYRLELHYRAGASATPAIGTVDVGRFDVPPATPFARADLAGDAAGIVRRDFTVPAGGASQVETRVFYAGSGSLSVDAVTIVRSAE